MENVFIALLAVNAGALGGLLVTVFIRRLIQSRSGNVRPAWPGVPGHRRASSRLSPAANPAEAFAPSGVFRPGPDRR